MYAIYFLIGFIFYYNTFLIFSLEYPLSQIKEHEQEIDKLLPHVNNKSSLVQAARVLWKKWIVLKIVFKIPKLDRPKEGILYTHVIIFYTVHN